MYVDRGAAFSLQEAKSGKGVIDELNSGMPLRTLRQVNLDRGTFFLLWWWLLLYVAIRAIHAIDCLHRTRLNGTRAVICVLFSDLWCLWHEMQVLRFAHSE